MTDVEKHYLWLKPWLFSDLKVLGSIMAGNNLLVFLLLLRFYLETVQKHL